MFFYSRVMTVLHRTKNVAQNKFDRFITPRVDLSRVLTPFNQHVWFRVGMRSAQELEQSNGFPRLHTGPDLLRDHIENYIIYNKPKFGHSGCRNIDDSLRFFKETASSHSRNTRIIAGLPDEILCLNRYISHYGTLPGNERAIDLAVSEREIIAMEVKWNRLFASTYNVEEFARGLQVRNEMSKVMEVPETFTADDLQSPLSIFTWMVVNGCADEAIRRLNGGIFDANRLLGEIESLPHEKSSILRGLIESEVVPESPGSKASTIKPSM